MAYFGVKTQILDGAAGSLDSEAAKMLSLYNELISVKNNLHIQSAASGIIKSRIQSIAGDVNVERNGMRSMASGLRQISSLYDTYESKVIDHANGKDSVNVTNSSGEGGGNPSGKKQGNGGTAGGSGNDSGLDWKAGDTIGKIIGEFGVVGSVVSGVASVITGDKTDPKTWIGAVKDATSVGSDIYGNINPNPGETTDWKDWFGFNLKPVGSGGFGANFKEAISKELGKFKFGDNATTADKVSTVCKWAGVALSLGKNAVSNYDESKNGGISAGRAVAETITETAVDVAVGIGAKALATAAVGAAATALGFASAPAVVVGAAAVGVVWAADMGVKAINKYIFHEADPRGLTETVSDAVLDAGTAVAKGIGNAAKGFGKAVSSFGKSITKWAFA